MRRFALSLRPLWRCPPPAQASGSALALALWVAAAGCGDDGTTPPDGIRFGQIGEVTVTVESAVSAGADAEAGMLEEVLVWGSSGRWALDERIFYGGAEGDGTLREGNAGAGAYASLITQVNDVAAVTLFTPDLDPELVPECAAGRSRIHVSIYDEVRDETRRWTRCATGSFRTLSSVGAGPGESATRVAVAAILSRDFALGSAFLYSYTGSAPFRTLDRGENSATVIGEPAAFRSADGLEPAGWGDFWDRHTGGGAPPFIDWVEEMVLVAGVGEVEEAGDSVEIRRVLQLEDETLVEFYRRVPGDFCSPASIRHVPFHIVVAPRSESEVRFSEARIERVTCGG